MASSSQHAQHHDDCVDGNRKDLSCYLPLYKAASDGDWEEAQRFFKDDNSAMTVGISGSSKTALHIAAISGQILFVEKLVQEMPEEALEKKDSSGHTALYYAVVAGNIKAAKAMVEKNPRLPQIQNNSSITPILEAALLGHKELLRYLCEVTKDINPSPYRGQDINPSPYRGQDGLRLLNAVIAANFYDIALDLIELYPELATTRDRSGKCALHVLAQRSSAFRSGNGLGFWQNCIYPLVHVQETFISKQQGRGDVEDHCTENSKDHTRMVSSFHFLFSHQIIQAFQWLNGLFWNVAKHLVPGVKKVYDTKLMNEQAEKLVKCICDRVSHLGNHSKITELINVPFLVAAEYGTVDFITTCLQIFPQLKWVRNKNSHTILHIAIEHRQEKVFKLLQLMRACTNTLASYNVTGKNNILHLAAKLAPSPKLKAISGSALQMQRELQWFKAVEKISKPTYRDLQNSDKKTPQALFTEEHKELVEKGEKWMRDMASSCSVVATLISTVVFAAAFTVPGGNRNDSSITNESGIPIFQESRYFMLFALSNALGLISSLTSVLIFLSILTSRYAEEDFLESLPRKLAFGLATLFISIAGMAIAFSSAYFIMFDHRFAWIPILVISLACFPAILFLLLHFPLFIEIVRSTYGYDIFQRHS